MKCVMNLIFLPDCLFPHNKKFMTSNKIFITMFLTIIFIDEVRNFRSQSAPLFGSSIYLPLLGLPTVFTYSRMFERGFLFTNKPFKVFILPREFGILPIIFVMSKCVDQSLLFSTQPSVLGSRAHLTPPAPARVIGARPASTKISIASWTC